jgi:RTX toxin RtxA
MYGGINALIQVGKGNIQTRLLGGANVIVKVGDGNISALLFGLANIVKTLMPMLDRYQLWLKN